ncbi:MAG: mechanosensitive ion channel [Eubacterium sp.]|nr:mechanosensitive ion channel [Eubacterium sp.]
MNEIFENFSKYSKIPIGIVSILGTLIIGAIVIRIITTIVHRMLIKSSMDPSSYVAIIRAIRILLWILVGLSAVTAAGINPSPYIAVLASAGAALALALKDSLSNVAGGIIILFTHPFSKGDEIVVEDVSGIVDYIDIMTTKMHTFSNQDITIPNSKMVNSIIINRTKNDLVRVDCKFAVSYNSDLEKVKILLNNIVKDGDILLDSPAPVIGVRDYEESAIVWDMMVWTRTENRFKAKYYLGEQVKAVFQKNGIEIPYPHVDVRIEGEQESEK